eukprot:scaffold608894_cov14-Prasinocladus_malaysianus.AAC.1
MSQIRKKTTAGWSCGWSCSPRKSPREQKNPMASPCLIITVSGYEKGNSQSNRITAAGHHANLFTANNRRSYEIERSQVAQIDNNDSRGFEGRDW